MFQSTHSLRSATSGLMRSFYKGAVSIHALLAECDQWALFFLCSLLTFQSTHSLRSATYMPRFRQLPVGCFNPRTPCGVRLSIHASIIKPLRFQSTHSLRSATISLCIGGSAKQVSIHALLAECDALPCLQQICSRCFNPRTPCGVRLSGSISCPLT